MLLCVFFFIILLLEGHHRVNLVFEGINAMLRIDGALHADVVDDAVVLISEGSDEELVPERRSVGLVVEDARRCIRAVGDGLPYDVDCLGIGSGALEEATVPSEDLLPGITREFVETLAGVDDGIVGEAGVGQDEVLLAGGEARNEAKVRLDQLLRVVLVDLDIVDG